MIHTMFIICFILCIPTDFSPPRVRAHLVDVIRAAPHPKLRMTKPEAKTFTVIHTGLADYKSIGDALKVTRACR